MVLERITRGLGEYFLGTESIREYKAAANFFEERPDIEERVKEFPGKFKEVFEIGMGRVIPNLIAGLSIGAAVYTNDDFLLWGLAISEGMRNIMSLEMKSSRRYYQGVIDASEVSG